jgi:protein-tyrosine phosphatase
VFSIFAFELNSIFNIMTLNFQAEFELLPDRLPDRTTEACDAPCNRVKNRYPDIKCYDQTRVKLSKVEDREGSDYINANFVEGYKDRKKWICAQGPLEHTVADFWRMVHEQKVDIIIMLTNLEEYNRIKCAQYWPQAGDSNYCTEPIILNVGFCTETRYFCSLFYVIGG